MKTLKPNPEYRDAPYELGYIPESFNKDKRFAHHRFKIIPPNDIYFEPNAFNDWVVQNSIPTHIEVDE